MLYESVWKMEMRYGKPKAFMKNNNITRFDKEFYQHEYAIDKIGDMLRKHKPDFIDFWE